MDQQAASWAGLVLGGLAIVRQIAQDWISYRRDKRIADLETEVAICKQTHAATARLIATVTDLSQKVNGNGPHEKQA